MTNCTKLFFIVAIALFYFSVQSSLAENIIISSEQNGDIDLGSSSSATVDLEDGGILNGNILMGDSDQMITFNGGVLNGTIDGSGKITIATNTAFNGNIGSNSAITSIIINSSQNLDLTVNNNIIDSGTIRINEDAILNIGSALISASIRGHSDNMGTVRFNADNILDGNVGTDNATLDLIEIADGVNLDMDENDNNMNANLITIGNGAILNYGSGVITGPVEGSDQNIGTFIFNQTKTANFAIGQTNPLSEIKIIASKTATLGGDIAASIITIGGIEEGNSGGKIKSNGQNITADNINLGNNAVLDIDVNSNISGAINGQISAVGIVEFSGDGTINQPSALGANNKLAEINISDQTTLIMDQNITADEITIGEGDSGVLTQNSGILGADENSIIRLAQNSVFNYNGGTINGLIRGTSADKGTFNINEDYSNNYEIGATYDLANLNIAANKTLTANADIAANEINLSGNLNLGNISKNITGNLNTSGGSALIDLASANHNISGNFSTISGDILKLNIIDNNNFGALTIGGNAAISNNSTLQISFDSNQGYISNGDQFAIITADNGDEISAIDDIDVNNLGSNKSGLITFNSVKSGNNLLLIANRADVSTFTTNKTAQKIYNNIDEIGASATDELRELQKFIDNSSTSNSQRDSTLKSIIPQANKDLHISAIDANSSAINVIENRLDNSFITSKSSLLNQYQTNKSFNYFKRSKDINLNNHQSNFIDEQIFDKQAIWLQGFDVSANQKNTNDIDGYDLTGRGLAVGFDQQISKNLILGIAGSFLTSNSKSKSNNKKETDINSYQFSIYSGYDLKPFFIKNIISLAVNKYKSTRSIANLNLSANANYGGQTYLFKLIGGFSKPMGNFLLIPQIGLSAIRNQIETYSEYGAGNLNLKISNEKYNFLEGRAGINLKYNNWQFYNLKFQPKIKLSYGYDFIGSNHSTTAHFQSQDSSFQIKDSNINKSSLKSGFGADILKNEIIIFSIEYEMERKSNYNSKSGMIYLRYNF